MTMGMSCLIQGRETTEKIKFIPPEWSLKDDGKIFDARKPNMKADYENFWYLELGIALANCESNPDGDGR